MKELFDNASKEGTTPADIIVTGTDPVGAKFSSRSPHTTTPLSPEGVQPRHQQPWPRCNHPLSSVGVNSSTVPPRRRKTPTNAIDARIDPHQARLSPRVQDPSTSTSILGGGSATDELRSGLCAVDLKHTVILFYQYTTETIFYDRSIRRCCLK